VKLTRVQVKNFRSYSRNAAVLSVGDGLNLLIGPNNCGKSNLLRAVSLALENSGGDQFDEGTDIPQAMSWAYPTVILSFQSDKAVQVERTLLSYVSAYE
jgi:putative ATP-dependent endonuclease of OLD family